MASKSLMKIAGITERLVDLVKENTFLYDSNHEDHRDIEKRFSTWDSIADSMEIADMDGKQWREKWRNLRDVYIKQRKIMLKRDTTVVVAKRSIWRYFHLLFFLEPYVADNVEETMHLANFTTVNPIDLEGSKAIVSMCSSPIKIKVRNAKRPLEIKPKPVEAKPKPIIDEDELNGFLAPKRTRESFSIPTVSEYDPINLLFESYAARMKELPKQIQSYVHLQMSQIFFNAENPRMQMPISRLPELEES